MEGFNLSLSVYFLWSLLSCNIGFATKQSPVKGSKVFVLVLDGFIHDYEKYTENMPNFAKLASIGVKAERMIPPFPTFTWPCMTTLNTGLYPESHGIINNGFINISNGNVFSYTGDPSDLEGNAKFFKHEPLWLTNQRQGGKSFNWELSVVNHTTFHLTLYLPLLSILNTRRLKDHVLFSNL